MAIPKMKKYLLENILEKAVNGISLTQKEIVYLLTIEDPSETEKVMAAARSLREQYFGDRVFLYGFIYFSTYCRNHCAFCFYRNTNEFSPRYRKSIGEVVQIAAGLADSGVHLIDLTMGEDPLTHESGSYELLFEMVGRVKETTDLPVMISPGVVPDGVLKALADMRVDWYALYQETHNQVLFNKLRIGQSYSERAGKRHTAQQYGMLAEDGILLGAGETAADRANSFLAMKREGVHQVRVMTLVPQKQTPLAQRPSLSRINEYLSIAVMRLIMPDRLIPASLDVDGIKGLKMRLLAGANVITSIIPPSSSLAGVSQSSLDIEQGLRTVPEVRKILSDLGLSAADQLDYTAWLAGQKKIMADWGDRHADFRHYRRTASGFGSGLSGSTSRV